MYAGFWKRLAAALMDLLILLVPMLALGIVVALITGPKSKATIAADLSTIAVFWLYFAGMESSRRQATFGKSAFGIRVVGLDGERISFLRASARLLAKFLSALSLLVGFLMAALPPRKQALHDIVAGSLVVNSETHVDDLEAALPSRAPSAVGVFAIVLCVVCIPLAAAGAAVAVPAYQDYALRLKVNDAVQSARTLTTAVGSYMAQHKAPPRSLADARAETASPHLREAVVAGDGSIVVTLAMDKLEGKRIIFVPARAGPGTVTWTCSSEEVAARYLPKQCRR